MGRGTGSPLIGYLRTIAAASGVRERTDADLLLLFIESRDEAAFAALVRRHGPMVHGVCRRVLGHDQDAEDAFQATFLVLASKAGSVRRRGSLASFLHGVAERVARKARRARTRRRDRNLPMPDVAAPAAVPEFLWRDLRSIIDEEIRRLPPRYREPFVLCCLEGQTNAEAARHLGCPKGTVLSRLARARERLARRLRQRGITLSATVLIPLLTAETLRAAVPSALAASTAHLGTTLAAHGALPAGSVSAQVLALTTEGVKTMFWLKTTSVVAVLLSGVLLATTTGAERTPAPIAAEFPREVAEPAEKPRPEPPQKEKKAETPVDEILRKWAEADDRVREISVEFTRTMKDKTFEQTTVLKGRASIKKGEISRVDLQDKKGRMKEIWLLDGKRLHWFHFEGKTETISDLPPDWLDSREPRDLSIPTFLGINLQETGKLVRWQMLGPQARDFRSGSNIRLAKQDQWYVYLDITPRGKEGKSLFTRGRLVLNKEGWWVRQLWLEQENGYEILTDYIHVQANPEPPITREALLKGLPKGWKRIGPGL